jgi:hypothetical protein
VFCVCVGVTLYLHGCRAAWTVFELCVGFHIYIRAWFVCDMTSPVCLESRKGVLCVSVVIPLSERDLYLCVCVCI